MLGCCLDAGRWAAPVLLAFVLGSAALADEVICPQLETHPRSATLRDEFLKSRLVVGPPGAGGRAYQDRVLSVDTKTWKYWYAYRGTEPLSEEAFFSLCGREQQAADARRHRQGANRRAGVGTVLMDLGGIAGIAGVLLLAGGGPDLADTSVPLVAGGAVAMGLGALLLIPAQSAQYTACASYSEAQEAAAAYNERLCLSLARQGE